MSGDGTVFIEHYSDRPRHIEIQISANEQEAHLNEEARQAILNDATNLAQIVGYANTGAGKFLANQMGRHFIEISRCIQAARTITGECPSFTL